MGDQPSETAVEVKHEQSSPSTDHGAGGVADSKFIDFASDDMDAEDWIAPSESLEQKPIPSLTAEAIIEKDSPSTIVKPENDAPAKTESEAEADSKPEAAKEEASYTCDMCKDTFAETEDDHKKGRKHTKLLERLKKYGSLEAIEEAFKTVYCNLCNTMSNSQEQMEIHIKGSKHRARCKVLNLSPDLTDFPDKSKPKATGKTLLGSTTPRSTSTCYVCNIVLSSEQQLKQHETGKKHKDMLEQKQQGATGNKQQKKRPDGMPPSGPSVRPTGAPLFGSFVQGGQVGAKRAFPQDGSTNLQGPSKKSKPAPNTVAGGPPGTGQRETFFCDVCNIVLNSVFQRDEHMKGRIHKEAFARRKAGRQGPQNRPLLGRPAPQGTQKQRGQMGAKRPFAQDGGIIPQESSKGPKPLLSAPNSAAGGPPGPVLKQSFVCKVCKVVLNSKFQRDEHMKGRTHKDRLAGGRVPGSGLQHRLPQNQMQQNQPQRNLLLQQGMQNQNFYGNKAQKAPGPMSRSQGNPMKQKAKNAFFCRLCQVTFNSQLPYEQHMNSDGHFQRVQMTRSGNDTTVAANFGGHNANANWNNGGNRHGPMPGDIDYRPPMQHEQPWPMGGDNNFGAPPHDNERPVEGRSYFDNPMQQEGTWQDNATGAFDSLGSREPFTRQANMPFHDRPAEQAPSTALPNLNLDLSSLKFTKLQLDLALEISKLSQQLSKPEFTRELSEQLKSHVQRQICTRLESEHAADRPMGHMSPRSHPLDRQLGPTDDIGREMDPPFNTNRYPRDEFLPPGNPDPEDILMSPLVERRPPVERRTLFPSVDPAFERAGFGSRSQYGRMQDTIDSYGERRRNSYDQFEYEPDLEPAYDRESRLPLERDRYPIRSGRPLLDDSFRPSSSLLGRPSVFDRRF